MARLIPRYPAREWVRLCALYFPEERRHEFTSEPWDGVNFRHFQDPRVVCIEHFQSEDRPMSPVGRKPGRKPAA